MRGKNVRLFFFGKEFGEVLPKSAFDTVIVIKNLWLKAFSEQVYKRAFATLLRDVHVQIQMALESVDLKSSRVFP